MKKYICHVCGFPELEDPPWGLQGNSSSHNICSCCGLQFGYHDCQLTAYEQNKKNWIDSGASWFDIELKPLNWNLDEQLNNINRIPKELFPSYLRK